MKALLMQPIPPLQTAAAAAAAARAAAYSRKQAVELRV
jgi:hypothetical protein